MWVEGVSCADLTPTPRLRRVRLRRIFDLRPSPPAERGAEGCGRLQQSTVHRKIQISLFPGIFPDPVSRVPFFGTLCGCLIDTCSRLVI